MRRLSVLIGLMLGLTGAKRNPQAVQVVRAGNFTQIPPPDLLCNLSKIGQFERSPRCVSGLLAGGVVVGVLSGCSGL